MQVTFKGDTPPEFKAIFGDAFKLICQRLGIDGYQRNVNISFMPVICEEEPKAHGIVYPTGSQEQCERIKAGKPITSFNIDIKINNPDRMIQSLCHEMIHVKQWITGMLGIAYKDGEPIPLFHNRQIDKDSIRYEDQPWEEEAHREMNSLAIWVMKTMVDKAERKKG